MTQTKAELLQTRHQGDIRLGDADSTNYVGFKAPATVGSNLVWTLPATDGSANQFLQTNASGVLGWGTADVSSAMPLAGGTFTGNVTFGDSIEARFGASADLKIYHNHSNSWNYIKGVANNIAIQAKDGENSITAYSDGTVQLYHDGSAKLETSATGIAINGALTVSTNATITGNLTVSGTTTTVDSVTLSVKDKNIEMGVVSSPSDTTADGGGITLKGATDKTFNWVDSTDAWTSSEHLNLPDNKHLRLGTGNDLAIYHTASDSWIKEAGTGILFVDTNGSHIRLSSDSNTKIMANFFKDGAVDLYHNNNRKLETTATGINVTGAINVNGSALSTAPQITATADGAITAGNTVIVNTNGTVKKAQILVSELSTYLTDLTQTDSTYVWQGWAMSYHAHHEFILLSGKLPTSNSSTTNKPQIRAYNFGTSSTPSGAPTMVQQTNLAGGASWEGQGSNNAMAYHPTKQRTVILYGSETSPQPAYYAILEATSSTAFTLHQQSTEYYNPSGNIEVKHSQIVYTKDDKFVIIVWQNSTKDVYSKVATMASDGNSLSLGSLQTISGANTHANSRTRLYYDSNADKVVLITCNESGNGGLRARVGTVSGTSVSWSAATQADSSLASSGGYVDAAYMPDHNMGVCAWYNNTKGVIVQTLTISSGTISWGAKYYPTGGTSRASDFPGIVYDELTNKPIVFYQTTDDFEGAGKVLAISGTTLSQHKDLGDILTPSNLRLEGLQGSGNGPTFHSGLDNLIIPFRRSYNGSSFSFGIQRIQSGTTATNLTAENYIGIAAASVSDSASATIDVSGATNSNQSSLTAGQKYYVQNDGSLGLAAADPAIFAGTAISATKLIVNDQQPIPTLPLDEVDEWGQFTGDGNTSYGPWTNNTWGDESHSRQLGELTRYSYSGMPRGTGVVPTNGIFTFPSTGIYEISSTFYIQRYDGNAYVQTILQLSTNGGSSWISGIDSTGLDMGEIYVHSTYGNRGTVHPSVIVNITDTANYKFRVNISAGGNNMYVRPGSKIRFKKIG